MAAILRYINVYSGIYNHSTGTIYCQDTPKYFFIKVYYMLKFQNPKIPHKKFCVNNIFSDILKLRLSKNDIFMKNNTIRHQKAPIVYNIMVLYVILYAEMQLKQNYMLSIHAYEPKSKMAAEKSMTLRLKSRQIRNKLLFY